MFLESLNKRNRRLKPGVYSESQKTPMATFSVALIFCRYKADSTESLAWELTDRVTGLQGRPNVWLSCLSYAEPSALIGKQGDLESWVGMFEKGAHENFEYSDCPEPTWLEKSSLSSC